jgi:phage terminase small subunit
MESKRTEKQENFALEFMLNGKDASAAYRKVYDTKAEGNTLWVAASKLLHSNKVSQRVHELEMQEFSDQILTIEERKKLLTKVAKNGDIKAVDMLNKMDGIYIEKKQVEHSGQIIKRIINVNPTKKKK